MNDKSWNRLSPEHQKILVDAANEFGDWFTSRIDANLANAIKAMRDAGVTIIDNIDVGPMREKVAKRIQAIEAEGSMWRKGLYQEIQNIK